jgi:GTP cyclohydrolase I
MLIEMTTPCDIKWKDFPSEADEMVIVEAIPFTSLCAHHVLPFIGVAHVAYIPQGKIAGLSKFARVVKHFAARLQVQEELTGQIAHYLEDQLDPIGVGVVLKAEHLCMSIRGVQAVGTTTTTSCMLGAFGDHSKQARGEFLSLIKHGNRRA